MFFNGKRNCFRKFWLLRNWFKSIHEKDLAVTFHRWEFAVMKIIPSHKGWSAIRTETRSESTLEFLWDIYKNFIDLKCVNQVHLNNPFVTKEVSQELTFFHWIHLNVLGKKGREGVKLSLNNGGKLHGTWRLLSFSDLTIFDF